MVNAKRKEKIKVSNFAYNEINLFGNILLAEEGIPVRETKKTAEGVGKKVVDHIAWRWLVTCSHPKSGKG